MKKNICLQKYLEVREWVAKRYRLVLQKVIIWKYISKFEIKHHSFLISFSTFFSSFVNMFPIVLIILIINSCNVHVFHFLQNDLQQQTLFTLNNNSY